MSLNFLIIKRYKEDYSAISITGHVYSLYAVTLRQQKVYNMYFQDKTKEESSEFIKSRHLNIPVILAFTTHYSDTNWEGNNYSAVLFCATEQLLNQKRLPEKKDYSI